jgi:eukaryotic-like serine/threonine-protein kinase
MPLGFHVSTIRQYRLEAMVGHGNMGIVYRGFDTRRRRPVAVKLLAAHRIDEQSRARFRHEAHLLARLSHPNIARMFEFGRTGAIHYIVMELVQGKTLRDLLETAPLPASQVAALGAQLARGLAAAHDAGVIHRDIKPPNLCVTPDGVLKILDFGVAIGPSASAADTTESGESVLPALAGTLQYMAPERLRGVAADARTDIFSAGMVLYELACGRLPYSGEQPARLIEAKLSGKLTRPSRIVPDLDRELERVILRALEFDPDRRYQRATDLADDIERIQPSVTPREFSFPARVIGFLRGTGRLASSMFLEAARD